MAVTINGSGTIGGLSAYQQGAGLTLIASQSFSAVSSVSVNNCFSSAYDNYFILYRATATGASDIAFRLRSAGTDASSSVYAWGYMDSTTSGYFGQITAQSQWRIGRCEDSSSYAFGDANILGPYLSAYTGMTSKATTRQQGNVALHNGTHAASTSYDGFSLIFGASTTGSLRVYGYTN